MDGGLLQRSAEGRCCWAAVRRTAGQAARRRSRGSAGCARAWAGEGARARGRRVLPGDCGRRNRGLATRLLEVAKKGGQVAISVVVGRRGPSKTVEGVAGCAARPRRRERGDGRGRPASPVQPRARGRRGGLARSTGRHGAQRCDRLALRRGAWAGGPMACTF